MSETSEANGSDYEVLSTTPDKTKQIALTDPADTNEQEIEIKDDTEIIAKSEDKNGNAEFVKVAEVDRNMSETSETNGSDYEVLSTTPDKTKQIALTEPVDTNEQEIETKNEPETIAKIEGTNEDTENDSMVITKENFQKLIDRITFLENELADIKNSIIFVEKKVPIVISEEAFNRGININQTPSTMPNIPQWNSHGTNSDAGSSSARGHLSNRPNFEPHSKPRNDGFESKRIRQNEILYAPREMAKYSRDELNIEEQGAGPSNRDGQQNTFGNRKEGGFRSHLEAFRQNAALRDNRQSERNNMDNRHQMRERHNSDEFDSEDDHHFDARSNSSYRTSHSSQNRNYQDQRRTDFPRQQMEDSERRRRTGVMEYDRRTDGNRQPYRQMRSPSPDQRRHQNRRQWEPKEDRNWNEPQRREDRHSRSPNPSVSQREVDRHRPVRIICSESYSRSNARHNCIFCNGPHFSDECHQVVDVQERKDMLLSSGRCTNCLGRHNTSNCRMLDLECAYCKEMDTDDHHHHCSICPFAVNRHYEKGHRRNN